MVADLARESGGGCELFAVMCPFLPRASLSAFRHQREAARLRGRGIADRAAPTLPAIIRTVHAALIRGPQLSAFRAGAEQRRDGAGWLRPAVADALPTLASETAIQPAIRAASHVRGVRSGRR